jgi:hypothetical protein
VFLKIFGSVFVLLASGCASTADWDERTTQEKAAATKEISRALVGEYVVADARNERFLTHDFKNAKFASLRQSAEGEAAIVTLTDQRGKQITMISSNCQGHTKTKGIEGNNRFELFCNSPPNSVISYFVMGVAQENKQLRSGAVIPAYSPMDIRKGDFILDFSEARSGRPHHYILRRVDTPAIQ